MFLTKFCYERPNSNQKFRGCSKDFAWRERQKYALLLRKKDEGALDINRVWYKTQRNLILGVNSGCNFKFDSFWNFVTKCDRYYCKNRKLFYYEVWEKVYITKCVSFLSQNVTVITKCDKFIITKCDSFYKITKCLLHLFITKELFV